MNPSKFAQTKVAAAQRLHPAVFALALLTGLALVLSFPSLSRGAETPEWTVDPVHSTVAFSIQHIAAPVSGRFNDFEGTIAFDPDHPEQGHISVEIKTASVDTGNEQRDTHLKSPDFFDSAAHPLMTFTSSDIRPVGGDSYVAKGPLTIRGVTEEIELNFVFNGIKPHPMQEGKQVAGFEAGTVIDRLQFNVGDGRFFKGGMIGKEVKITIFIEALR